MFKWDSTRRDGRSIVSGKLETIEGYVLSEDKKNIVIRKVDGTQIKLAKGSFKYYDMPKGNRYFIICNNKLVDWI